MLRLLTNEVWQEYNHDEVPMNIHTLKQRKEVTTLDADVPLLRPTLTRFNVSELRMFKTQADRLKACHFGLLDAV